MNDQSLKDALVGEEWTALCQIAAGTKAAAIPRRSGGAGAGANDRSCQYLRVAAVLVPKEMNVAIEQKAPGGLEPEPRVLDLIQAAGADGDPRDVFEIDRAGSAGSARDGVSQNVPCRLRVPIAACRAGACSR
jgi:hypothetical protein